MIPYRMFEHFTSPPRVDIVFFGFSFQELLLVMSLILVTRQEDEDKKSPFPYIETYMTNLKLSNCEILYMLEREMKHFV